MLQCGGFHSCQEIFSRRKVSLLKMSDKMSALVMFGKKYDGKPASEMFADEQYVNYFTDRGNKINYMVIQGKPGWYLDSASQLPVGQLVNPLGKTRFRGMTLDAIAAEPDGLKYLVTLSNMKKPDGTPKFSFCKDVINFLTPPAEVAEADN